METEISNEKKLFLLDAYALIYRSYFAFIKNPRYNSKGLNTSSIFGFVNTLEQVLNTEYPSHIAVVFDVHGDTFRNKMFSEYKANREAMPEDIRASIPHIRNLVEAYNIPILEMEGYEADDVIGTIAEKASTEGFVTYMMTPDKDYAQLVGENIFIYKPAKGGDKAETWGIEKVKENFEVENPSQVIDVLGLMGDAADNIPGCPGIGPKTAMKLISEYGSVEGVYQNIDKLKGKLKDNLEQYKDQVLLSRELIVIDKNVPIDIDFEKMKYTGFDEKTLLPLFRELEFRSFYEKFSSKPVEVKVLQQQGTLFDMQEQEAGTYQSAMESISTVEHKYFKVETEIQRTEVIKEILKAGCFSFDTETTGLDPHSSELVCISISIKEHDAWCILLPAQKDKAINIVREFKPVFENVNILKIGQNLKFDLIMLARYELEVKGPMFDTLIAHYLIQPELKHNLDYLSELYFNYKKISYEELVGGKGQNQRPIRSIETDRLVDYSCEDADFTYQLKDILEKELKGNDLISLFNDIEMPLVPVLTSMELAGVKMDPTELNSYAGVLREQLINLESEIFKLAGEEFLISSPKQLGIILFEKLNIDPTVKKTKTKQYSTNEEILVRLSKRHPIIDKILEYRGLRKLLNTYVEALPKLINQYTGKIHTSYNQAITSTGRLSSVNPNLQNIPIRDENGREIRKAFIPSERGMKFISADYSQIELRIMASLSDDINMKEAFSKNADIHAITASKIYGVPVDKVTSDYRRKAKTANFGIIYGISSFGLSQRLNIQVGEAKEIIDGYFAAFPGVKEYMKNCIEEARKNGFVKTLLGRKRYLGDINSTNSVVRGNAERNAINAPIQGTAADIIKIAMINIFNRMETENLKSKMILQVHDELIFDAHENELEYLKSLVKHEMENAFSLGVPLTVDVGTGNNWLEAH
ncbi:MAG: DNA polymerase I [Prolixibacteraceae bacterium]|nr:DNA polymerase I [Prolixibacteraceae bacterium]